MDPQLLQTAKKRATDLAEKVLANPCGLNLLSHLTRIGEDAYNYVSSFFDMRRVTVSEMMKKVSDGSQNGLPGQIKPMRAIKKKYDPRGFKERMAPALIYGGNRRHECSEQVLTGLRTSIATNFELHDTIYRF
jgi:hypothetical protein